MTKTKSEKMHFRTRCLERLGKVYTQEMQGKRKIIGKINGLRNYGGSELGAY